MRSRIIRLTEFSQKAASQIRSVLGAHPLSAFVTNTRASRTSNDVHRYFVNRVAPSRYRLHASIESLSPRSQYRSAALCRPPWDRKALPLVFPRRFELGELPFRGAASENMDVANSAIGPCPAPYFPFNRPRHSFIRSRRDDKRLWCHRPDWRSFAGFTSGAV